MVALVMKAFIKSKSFGVCLIKLTALNGITLGHTQTVNIIRLKPIRVWTRHKHVQFDPNN